VGASRRAKSSSVIEGMRSVGGGGAGAGSMSRAKGTSKCSATSYPSRVTPGRAARRGGPARPRGCRGGRSTAPSPRTAGPCRCSQAPATSGGSSARWPRPPARWARSRALRRGERRGRRRRRAGAGVEGRHRGRIEGAAAGGGELGGPGSTGPDLPDQGDDLREDPQATRPSGHGDTDAGVPV
jgi:hypothetical protein